MALVTRRRPRRPARTEARYAPDDTPYPYPDCRKGLRQLAAVAEQYRLADVEERLGAQVDLLRMALKTVAAEWLDPDGAPWHQTLISLINQREADQKLARLALKLTRRLDDDRTKLRLAGRTEQR